MLEDMDKKSPRSVQAPIKGNSSEQKKQDVTANSKQLPRWRKREPSNSSVKIEQGKKSNHQKIKTFDKRPRSRGNYSGSRKEETKIEEQLEDELGLQFTHTQGKQKKSLNHLLNFHYVQNRQDVYERRPSQIPPNSTKALMATRAHKYNKEHFLQANCQFVVKMGADYSQYLADPDLLVSWELIEQVLVRSSEEVSCPICLCPPTAGKITRCGHIFCWACILHYLALSDHTWRKCPICYEAIHKDHLKSVECLPGQSLKVGDTVTLHLMKREKDSLIATPVGQFEDRLNQPLLSLSETKLDICFSKLLLASYKNVETIIHKERLELDTQMKEFLGTPELVFVEEALNLLAERLNLLQESKNGEVSHNQKSCNSQAEHQSYEPNQTEEFTRIRQKSTSSESEDATKAIVEDLLLTSYSHSSSTKHFYFYQVEGGSHGYLHALNARMLEMMYGSLEKCPSSISGKIIEIESGSMTTQLRSRLRYLRHLPVTCQFEVIELNLTPIVNDEVINCFKDSLEARRKTRTKRARQDKRQSRVAEEVERRWMGGSIGHLPQNVRIESHFDFPQFGDSTHVGPTLNSPIGSENSSRNSSPLRIPSSSSVFESLSMEPVQRNENPSFAQMVREGGVSGVEWSEIGQEVKRSSNKGCWNSGVDRGDGQSRHPSSSTSAGYESDTECFSPPAPPVFTLAHALQMATIAASSSSNQDSINNNGSEEQSNGRKKKKKKQKVLFSTGVLSNPNIN